LTEPREKNGGVGMKTGEKETPREKSGGDLLKEKISFREEEGTPHKEHPRKHKKQIFKRE